MWGGALVRLALALVVAASLAARLPGQVDAADLSAFSGHWIDVNLATLTATAYDGTRAVYSAPVTAGKRGFATPTGTFRIYSRVRIKDMRSSPGDKEQYYVKNVEYVQYFKAGGFAIHSNYWAASSVFGKSFTSHGCVSMRPANAAYFWKFASIGTPIRIHYTSPKVSVSKVVGKSQSDAKSRLQAAGFKVAATQRVSALSAPGTVLEQKPAGGASATKGSSVSIVVAAAPKGVPAAWSLGSPYPPLLPYGDPGPGFTWAPVVVGLPESLAVSRIEQAGLRSSHVERVDVASVPESMREAVKAAAPGTVVASSASAGALLPRGSGVLLIVKRK